MARRYGCLGCFFVVGKASRLTSVVPEITYNCLPAWLGPKGGALSGGMV
jgi:hypothetical protein